ncbi:MAG TPA: ATP-dependent DNA helicase [Candidatus Bathyarchaeia archaeon]|nr:ATP-dependent DNA helicase [Candidatus Bathyarchaeia archaeon]
MSTTRLTKRILDGKPKLSLDQRKAVISKSRYNRVIAGAGAGKTETLTRRIVYLLSVEGAKPEDIVAFTFTEKAAQSMKSRVYQRVGEICGEKATANLGEMYIGTIHAYAKRVLEDHFGFGNCSVLDDNQEIAFLLRHGWEMGLHVPGRSYSNCCRDFLRTVNMAWDELLDEKTLKRRAPEFFRKLEQYEELLKEHRLLTFGRMIYEAVLKLREAPDTLSKIKYLLVDEYQDINRAQAELIEYVGKKGGIFVVGDPRQSIYQWRGSDERFFFSFSDKFPDTLRVNINENRRSGKRIVWNANKFASTFERGHYEAMDPTRSEEGFVAIARNETAENEASWIVDQIQALMEGNDGAKYSDFGVLTRSVSTSAGPIIDELKERRIPYIVGGKVGLFKRDEAQAVGRIFAWFSNDGFWTIDAHNWDEKITGDDLLTSALACWDMAHPHGHPKDAEQNLRKIKDDLNSDEPTYNNFTKIYYDVLTALGFYNLDYRDRNDAAIMANLGRFNNLLTDFESANRFGGHSPRWIKDLKDLCWFMGTYAISAYEELPSDDIRGVDAVQVMTVHQAKGLEWPTVFLFATVVRRFPSSMVGREQDWCGVPRDMFDVARYESDKDDERRLFYVAITRAKDALVVSHFSRLTRAVSRSEFIDDMDLRYVIPLNDGAPIPSISIHPGTMSDEIQTFSASEIVTFGICPHMYLLRELWGYQPQLNPAIGYGNGMHYCLKRAGELVKDGYSPVSAVATSVDEGFHMPFVGGSVLETFKNSARKKLVAFSQKYGGDLNRIEEVEYRLEFPINEAGITSATVMGKVDVILRSGGELEVRDYKSSEEARTLEEVGTQIRLYTSGLRTMGRPVSSGSVAYLDEAEIKQIDVSDKLLTEAKQNAQKVVERIAKRKFKPNPGESCDRCDQKPICRWRKN